MLRIKGREGEGKMKILRKWAGYVNGHIDITRKDYNGYRLYAIYPNRRTAKLCYQDVRKIEIKELETP